MNAENRSDNDHTAKEASSADSHTARDPTISEDSHTARDPTISEASNTAREPGSLSSSGNLTAREPGTDTEQDNRVRIQTELEGPVQESMVNSSAHGGGYLIEEYDMTSVMFNKNHPTDPATAEAEAARKKKLAAKKR